MLSRVAELTGGASLASNIALVRNNARVGAEIAVEAAKLMGPRAIVVPPAAGGGWGRQAAIQQARGEQHPAQHPTVGIAAGALTEPRIAHAGRVTDVAVPAVVPAARSPRTRGTAKVEGSPGDASSESEHARKGASQTAAAAAAVPTARTRSTRSAARISPSVSDPHGFEPKRRLTCAAAAVERHSAAAARYASRCFHSSAHTHENDAEAGTRLPQPCHAPRAGAPLIVGGAVMDLLCKPKPGMKFVPATSNPGIITQSLGGVGRNVAEALTRLSAAPLLITVLGDDAAGARIRSTCASVGMTVVTPPTNGGACEVASRVDQPAAAAAVRTATYAAMLDDAGELVAAIADMAAFDTLTPGTLAAPPIALADRMRSASIAIVDANVPPSGTALVCRVAAANKAEDRGSAAPVPVLFEAISVAKCVRIVEAGTLHLTAVVKPNRYEVAAIAAAWRDRMGLPPIEAEVRAAAAAGDADAAESDPTGVQGVEMDGPGLESLEPNNRQVDMSTAEIIGDDGGAATTRSSAARTDGTSAMEAGEEVLAVRETVVVTAPGTGGEGSETELRGKLVDAETLRVSPSAHTGDGGDEIKLRLFRELGLDAEALAESGITLTTDDEVAEATTAEHSGTMQPAGFDYALLLAAKTVLAGMIRPGGTATPMSPQAAQIAAEAAGLKAPPASPSPASPSAAQPAAQEDTKFLFPGGTIEGRKHVLVTLGSAGVLWLSAPPAKDDATADLCAALPFFTAARHPDIDMDFKLCPAPPASVVKATGAGDTLVGAVAWGIVTGRSMAASVRLGLAAAKLALETPGGAVPATLSPSALAAELQHVQPVDDEYA